MEVEGPTDGAVAVGRGAAGMAAVSSTDTTGAATRGAAAAREQARRYRTGRQAQMTSNQRKRMKKLKAREQGK